MIRARHIAVLALGLVLGACAHTLRPPQLNDAESIYKRLVSEGAEQRGVEGDLIRANDAIKQANTAVTDNKPQEFANGLAHIALRQAQTADAKNARVIAQQATDSLQKARLNRMLTLSEAQRQRLSSQQQLSQQEIEALRQRNAQVSQQADSLRVRNDSLRRAAEAASAQLNDALTRLRSLVTEITNLRETSRGIVISLSDILFDVNKATLKPGNENKVRQIAAILKQYPDKQISVEGHTDATGSDALNNRLSQDRAASVRAALVAGGVDSSIITSKGFGKTQPVASNTTAEGRQANRRVEIIVLGAGTVADAARARSDTTRTSTDSTAQKPPR